MNYRIFVLFCVVSLGLLLGGCGQTGPLYLPTPEEAQPETTQPVEDTSPS